MTRRVGGAARERVLSARLADLTAHLVAVRAPSRLLWRLSGVNPDARFDSLAALIAHIESPAQTGPRLSREPM